MIDFDKWQIHIFHFTHVLFISNVCNWPNKYSGRWGIPCRMYLLLSTYCDRTLWKSCYINPQFGLRFWHFLIRESCFCAPWFSHRSPLQKSPHSRCQHMPAWACKKRDFHDDVFIFLKRLIVKSYVKSLLTLCHDSEWSAWFSQRSQEKHVLIPLVINRFLLLFLHCFCKHFNIIEPFHVGVIRAPWKTCLWEWLKMLNDKTLILHWFKPTPTAQFWAIPKWHKLLMHHLETRRYRAITWQACHDCPHAEVAWHLWKLSVGQRHHTRRMPMLVGGFSLGGVLFIKKEFWLQFLFVSTLPVADDCHLLVMSLLLIDWTSHFHH